MILDKHCDMSSKQIKVNVKSFFLEEQSEPSEDNYIWAYKVYIKNNSMNTVKLVSRCWKIIDENGYQKEVRGDGVVGEQPILKPGETFEYTSGTPLNTRSGLMHGSYLMTNDKGKKFEVKIPAFSLDIPNSKKIQN